MEIKRAVRHAVPILMSISGVSGSGKTFTGLLIAAGLAKPGDKIGFLDTENRRGCMYADTPAIVAALPDGYYDTIELTSPFSPERYIEAINTFEHSGYKILVIDSGSHAWEGTGSCSDMAAEDDGRWNRAKLWNKRLIMRLLNSNMHIVVCLRAREKSKIIPKAPGRKEETISLGILPVCEKNFPFEMFLSFLVEEYTHLAKPIKVPDPLKHLFKEPRLLGKADGEAIRKWNETGVALPEAEQLKRRARFAAEQGMEAYKKFFAELPPKQKKQLDSVHAENKAVAARADADAARAEANDANETSDAAPEHVALNGGDDANLPVFGSVENPVAFPDDFMGPALMWNGVKYEMDEAPGTYKKAA